MGDPVVNYLNAIGIRVKLRPIERTAFQKGWTEVATPLSVTDRVDTPSARAA